MDDNYDSNESSTEYAEVFSLDDLYKELEKGTKEISICKNGSLDLSELNNELFGNRNNRNIYFELGEDGQYYATQDQGWVKGWLWGADESTRTNVNCLRDSTNYSQIYNASYGEVPTNNISTYNSPNTTWCIGDGACVPAQETNIIELLNNLANIETISITTKPKEIGTYNTNLENVNPLINDLNRYLNEYKKIAEVILQIYKIDATDFESSSYNSTYKNKPHTPHDEPTTHDETTTPDKTTTPEAPTTPDETTTPTVFDKTDDIASSIVTSVGSVILDTNDNVADITNGDYGDITIDKKRVLFDENGNPILDENGNPIYVDANSKHTVTGYKMDENGRIYAYQIDNKYWIFLEDNETFYLNGQLGYYIFDGDAELNLYDEFGNIIGKLEKGNYAIFDVKYNDNNEVIAIQTIINGKKTWIYINQDGNTYGDFEFIGDVQENDDGSKFIKYNNKTIFGILGILLVAAGAYVIAKKLKDKDKDNKSINFNEEKEIKEGKYNVFDIKKDENGNTTAYQIDKDNDLWVETDRSRRKQSNGRFNNNNTNSNNNNNSNTSSKNGKYINYDSSTNNTDIDTENNETNKMNVGPIAEMNDSINDLEVENNE